MKDVAQERVELRRALRACSPKTLGRVAEALARRYVTAARGTRGTASAVLRSTLEKVKREEREGRWL